MAPWDCLPKHIDEPHEWDGYDDDDHFYTRWRKKIKGWFAIGNAANRSKHKWANWRKWPLVIFMAKGSGAYRVENDVHDRAVTVFCAGHREHWFVQFNGEYLSRVQYWCDWHIALQWPLFLHGHYKNCQFYVGLKRDADKVYWSSLYLGRCWK